MTEETILKRSIREYLRYVRGVFVWHNLQGLGCFRGLPDIMVLRGGALYAIEAKAKKGWMSKYQDEFKTEFERAGGIFIEARSVDDVRKIIK